jgi:hypothetical protein
MGVDQGALVTGALAVIGGIVWLVRLEGRVDKGENNHQNLKESHDDLKADVKYIRERIDDALGR